MPLMTHIRQRSRNRLKNPRITLAKDMAQQQNIPFIVRDHGNSTVIEFGVG